MEVFKDILFYAVISIGTICLFCLLIAALIRCFTILLDHLKVANLLRKLLLDYIKNKEK